MKIENKPLYTVVEVMSILGCSMAKAYQIIRQLNEEMQKQGYYTVGGKVNSQYFRDKFKLSDDVNTIETDEAKEKIKEIRLKNANKK